mgnify:CR=1 FL=1
MAESSLDRLSRIREIEVVWKSYELRPETGLNISPEREAAYKRKVDANWPNVQEMARGYGLEFGPRNRNVRSRLALEGAKFAEDAGLASPYARAMFHAHFTDGRDIGDTETLVDIARVSGLDGEAFRVCLEQRTMRERVNRELALAAMYRLSGVPAFIVGGKYLVVGAQPLEMLVDVVDKAVKWSRGQLVA